MLSESALQELMPPGAWGSPLHYYPSVGSTNQVALELAEGGAPEGTLVVADEQTAGRGRAGRRWHTPAGTALAFSLILRPSEAQPGAQPLEPPGRESPGGTGLMAALAVAEALETHRLKPQLKWPNDVLLGGAKVAGVLPEAAWSGQKLDYVVVGIGVNVREGSLPERTSMDYPATWVEAALSQRVNRAELLATIVAGLQRWSPRLGHLDWLAACEARLAFRGELIRMEGVGEPLEGLLLGLTLDGWLRLAAKPGDVLELEPGYNRLRPVSR